MKKIEPKTIVHNTLNKLVTFTGPIDDILEAGLEIKVKLFVEVVAEDPDFFCCDIKLSENVPWDHRIVNSGHSIIDF